MLPARFPVSPVILSLVALLAWAFPAGALAAARSPSTPLSGSPASEPAAAPTAPAEEDGPEPKAIHVWAGPDLEPGTAVRLAQMAEEAHRFLAARLDLHLGTPVTLAAYGKPASYEEAAVALGVPRQVARGLAEGTAGLTTADGGTVLLNVAVARRAGPLPAVIAHELTHSLLRTNGITGAARWLEEGLAHRLQNEFCLEKACRTTGGPLQPGSPFRPELPTIARVRTAARRGLLGPLAADTGIPSREGRGGAAHGPQEYAAVAFLELQARYGDTAISRYLRLVRDLPHDQAFATSFGLSPAAWERALRESLRSPAPPAGLRLCLALQRGAAVTLTTRPADQGPGPTTPGNEQVLTLPRGTRCFTVVGAPEAAWLTVSIEPSDSAAAGPFGRLRSLDLIFRAEPGLAYFAGSMLRLRPTHGAIGGETVYSQSLQTLEGVTVVAAEVLAADTGAGLITFRP